MKLSPNIKAIAFDVGGTLIEPWPSVGQIYAEVADRHGYRNISAELLQQRFVAAWPMLKDFNYTRTDWARLVDATFDGLTEQPPSETFFTELYGHFARPDTWRIFPDVLPALEMLASRGMRLAIISNWDERLRPLLHALHLDNYFDPIVISCEIGFCKPSRMVFEAAAEQLGLPAPEILHVGDSLANDVQGARAAGFQARLLVRHAKSSAKEQINSLNLL